MQHQNRPANELDAQSISTLILAGSADGVGIEGTSEELDRWRLANALSSTSLRRIDDKNTLVLVTEADAFVGLLGTAYVEMRPSGRYYLGGLYCSVRGRGVGGSLMSDMTEWVDKRGGTLVEMTIARDNETMRRLATAFGFELESTFHDEFFPSGTFGRWFLRV